MSSDEEGDAEVLLSAEMGADVLFSMGVLYPQPVNTIDNATTKIIADFFIILPPCNINYHFHFNIYREICQ